MTMAVEPENRAAPKDRLPRVLGPVAALCVIVGSVIGSGIFIVPARVAREVPAIGPILILWAVAGLFSLAGALTMAELAAMIPRAGGPYVYLREAYGRLPGFLFGWTEFLVIRAGSIATLAAAFALYFATVVPAPGGLDGRIWQGGIAIGAVLFVALINILGTRQGGGVQVVGTVLKVGALGAMMILPFALGQAKTANLAPIWPASFDGSTFTRMMAAVVGILWAYDGWVNTSSLAEEIRDPGRNIPLAMISGMLILIALYVGMTIVYHLVLPMSEITSAALEKGSPRAVSADFFRVLLGDRGRLMIALVVMCSTLISLNGNALSGPRAYFAMARDGLFPASLCRIHPKFQTPYVSILAQSAWSVALMVASTTFLVADPPPSGTLPGFLERAWTAAHEKPLYDLMYSYVIFGGTVIYTMTMTTVFVLRARRPDLHRPYRTWGYPITPLLYLGASSLLLYKMLEDNASRSESLSGLAIILLGLPAYLVFSRRSARDPEFAGSEKA